MLQCSYCAKEFKYESEKKRHEQSHIPQFECKECSKKFSFISALKRHQKQHQRTCSVVCCSCGRNFRDDSLLKRHIKYAHTGVHNCPNCEAKFNSELALSTHMKCHKPKSERRFKCSYIGCNKSFNFTHHLKHHELTHTNEKQHTCKICGKAFIQLHHLKSHLKTHELTNWYNCPMMDCNRKFSSTYSMKRHLSTHRTVLSTASNKMENLSLEKHETKYLSKEEQPKEASVKLLSNIEENGYNNENEEEFTNCKTMLGKCLVSEDSTDNSCLCAQIKTGVDYYDIASPIEPFNAQDERNSIELNGDKDVLNNTRESCDCSSLRCTNVNVQSASLRRGEINDLPQIEYRNDGVIKIKDTFDLDITENVGLRKDVNVDDSRDLFKFNNFVPYNSCKAVLGKCIVSGNGNINEECLCARMAMDDQTSIAQEIDEITPQPITSIE